MFINYPLVTLKYIYIYKYNSIHSFCRGAANHSRVAEGTRPSPEGVYSGGSWS